MAKKITSIEILGVDEVERYLKKSSKKVQTAAKVAMQENGILLKEEVEASINGQRAEKRSVDTGAFLNSISFNISDFDVTVSSDVLHSIFMEYGTIYIPERRHFRNSLDRITPIAIRKLQDTINDEVD